MSISHDHAPDRVPEPGAPSSSLSMADGSDSPSLKQAGLNYAIPGMERPSFGLQEKNTVGYLKNQVFIVHDRHT